MWSSIKSAWNRHGTKQLGGAVIFLGALQTMTLWFTPKFIQLIGAASSLAGGLVMRRGFENTRNKDDADDTH